MANIANIIVTSDSIKAAQSVRRLCTCLASAMAEYTAKDTEHTLKGSNAMRRIGGMILQDIKKPGAKVPFASIDSMLAYLNTAKQQAAKGIDAIGTTSKVSFVDSCTLHAWRKIHTDTVAACDAFQAAWKAGKASKSEQFETINVPTIDAAVAKAA